MGFPYTSLFFMGFMTGYNRAQSGTGACKSYGSGDLVADVGLKTVQQTSCQMQDHGCVVWRTEVGNNRVAEVQNQEPGAESEPSKEIIG